jgi:2-polyprenyl-3-methyl-5-hydroxy-6-metoxy-1,4-benzoquinol methylase
MPALDTTQMEARSRRNIIASRYHHDSAEAPHTAGYLTPAVVASCRRIGAGRILDVGCGNGALCGALSAAGFQVIGCDPSEEGVALARRAHPHITFHLLGVYDEPTMLNGSLFDAVVSTEVIEHLFLPGSLPRFASRVLRPRGHLILTTPYHGYLKNLALSLAGQWDRHFSPSWDGGHIKFWSRATLTQLLSEEGFSVSEFVGAGRLPYLWKSMVLTCRKG